MTTIIESSLDQALGYARAGHSVGWFDDGRGVVDAIYLAWLALRDDPDVSVLRANGREQIRLGGGGSVRFFRSATSARGCSLDVAFVSSKHRSDGAMSAIRPALVTSDVGRTYALCERIE